MISRKTNNKVFFPHELNYSKTIIGTFSSNLIKIKQGHRKWKRKNEIQMAKC